MNSIYFNIFIFQNKKLRNSSIKKLKINMGVLFNKNNIKNDSNTRSYYILKKGNYNKFQNTFKFKNFKYFEIIHI